jgi:drug/metabolite transporter superfamily protein YnfA
MESAFAWLGQLFETFYKFIPHILIIRATHGGVYVAQSVMWRPARFSGVF